jgi:hypothetical protein
MLIVVPTRGRPANAQRLIYAVNATATFRPELHFAVDEDDPTAHDYLRVFAEAKAREGVRVTYSVGPRIFVGPTLNHIAVRAEPRNLWIAFMGDDHVPESVGWDHSLVEPLGPVGISYGNDLFQGPNLPTAVVMTANIVRWLGYMVPPTLKHLYLDNFWKELGTQLGILHYVPNVIIRHHHYQAGLAEHDQTYAEANSGERWTEDSAAWEDYRTNVLPGAVQLLREKMVHA